MSKILVVDDERNVLSGFEEVLGPEGHEVITAHRAQAALERIKAEEFDLVILDVRMPGMSGLDALKQIKLEQPRLPVIIMTGQGTMETAVEATKRGAFDYHLKPFEPGDMLQTIEKALQCTRLMKGQVALGRQDAAASGDAIIGQSSPMQEVYKAIGRVAQTDATVLIRGESGTGKEVAIDLKWCPCGRMPFLVLDWRWFGTDFSGKEVSMELSSQAGSRVSLDGYRTP